MNSRDFYPRICYKKLTGRKVDPYLEPGLLLPLPSAIFRRCKGSANIPPCARAALHKAGDCLSSPSGTSGRINQGEPRRCASTGRTSGNSPKYRSFRNLFVYHSRVSSGSVGIFPSKPLFSAWLWPRNIDSPSEEGRFHIATTCPVSGSFMFLHHNYPSLLSIAVISRHC